MNSQLEGHLNSNQNGNQNPKQTIAVTGAGGLVGSYLVHYLWQKGYPVIAIVRTPGKPQYFVEWLEQIKSSGSEVTVRLADVTDTQALERALQGADIVVHTAGEVSAYGARDRIFQTNVQGTKNVLDAACRQALKQFIHISSLSVITGQGDQFDVDETAPLRFCGENYADSKAATEEALRSYMAAGAAAAVKAGKHTQATILRPGFIYGPHEKMWMPRLIESIRTGKAALIDGGTKETNVINVENLCRAIELCFLNEKAFGQTFNLTDGEKVTKKMLFDAIADGMRFKRVSKQIPSSIARPFCELVSTVAPLLPATTQQKLARYSRAAFRLAGVNQGFSVKKAEKELHYLDRVPFAVGIQQALTYFEHATDSATKSEAERREAAKAT